MKKICFLITISLLFVVTAFSATCIAQEFKPMTLKCVEAVGENSFLGKEHQWWANEIEKRTGERIKIKFFWMESLMKQKDMLPGLKYGMADLAFFGAPYFPSNFPLYVIIENNLNVGEDFVAGMLAVMETLEKEPNMKAEMEREKIMLIAPYTAGTMYVGTKKCYDSIKDIKGQTIRTLGVAKLGLFQNLGANPVFMAYGDIYEAIDRGTIQAVDGALIMGEAYKHYQVMKCAYLHNVGSGMAGGMYISLDVFKKFPKDIQEVFLNLRNEFAVRFGQNIKEIETTILRDWANKYGVTIKYPSPEEKKIIVEAAQKGNETMLKQQESAGHTAVRKVWDYYKNALKKYEDERAKKK